MKLNLKNYSVKLKPEHIGLLCVLALYLIVFGVMGRDLYFIKGNLHDMWIPYLSAYAIKTGAVLHSTIHTSFGVFYSVLNYISLFLIEKNDFLSPSDLIFLSSCLFSIVITLLFLLYKKSAYNTTIYWMLLCLSLSTVFQLRDLSAPLSITRVLWYGSYNAHLWAVLLIQVASVLDLRLYVLNRKHDLCYKDVNVKFFCFFLLQFLCAFLALNYKLNFFIASLGLAGSIFFYLDTKLKALYVSLSLILFTLCLLFVSLVFGYSYQDYIVDLAHVIEAKKAIPSKILPLPFLFLFSAIVLDLKGGKNLSVLVTKIKTFCFKNNQSKGIKRLELNAISFSTLYFFVSISCALFVGIAGDWQRPAIYFIIVLCLLAQFNPLEDFLKKITGKLLCLVVTLNYCSLLYMLTLSPGLSSVGKQKISKYKSIQLLDKKKDFFISNYSSITSLYEFFKIDDAEKDFLITLSTNYKPTRRSWKLKFSNVEYDQMLNDAIENVENLVTSKSDDLLMLEFTNPLPIIFQTRIPDESFHWLHAGTTFSFKHVGKLYAMYKGAEVVYMPLISSDGNEQTYFNCSFYDWNLKNRRFEIVDISMLGIVFASKGKMKELGLTSIIYDEAMVQDNCQGLLKAPYLQD